MQEDIVSEFRKIAKNIIKAKEEEILKEKLKKDKIEKFRKENPDIYIQVYNEKDAYGHKADVYYVFVDQQKISCTNAEFDEFKELGAPIKLE